MQVGIFERDPNISYIRYFTLKFLTNLQADYDFVTNLHIVSLKSLILIKTHRLLLMKKASDTLNEINTIFPTFIDQYGL